MSIIKSMLGASHGKDSTQVKKAATAPQAKPKYEQEISALFPYESKFAKVLGAKMHYVEEGNGDPILLLHGNPTSSYLWRNIIPYLKSRGRVIAVDLIGMGKSDKPDIDYYFTDHTDYLEAFIEELGLKNVTLVIHDWGSALGMHYASRHEGNIKGVAFMEPIVPPAAPFPSYDAMRIGAIFKVMRDPKTGPKMLMDENAFIERILPGGVMRDLTEEELDAYRAPFKSRESRKPIWRWPNEVPIGGEPVSTTQIVENYSRWMLGTDTPFLLLYVSPGSLLPLSSVDWLTENLNNIETVFVGGGLHYIQEDQPEFIGRAIADWLRRRSDS